MRESIIRLRDVCRANPVSRAEAKLVADRNRAATTVDADVEIDFTGIVSVGHSFIDELLRVWPLEKGHAIKVVGCNDDALRMVRHTLGRTDLPQGSVEVVVGVKGDKE